MDIISVFVPPYNDGISQSGLRSVVESQGMKLLSGACVYAVSSRKLGFNNMVIKLDERLSFILRHFQATSNSAVRHPLVEL